MNQALFLAINKLAGENLLIDSSTTLIAEYLPVIFILWLLYLWFRNRELREEVLGVATNIVIAMGVNLLITLGYFHPRPFMVQPVHLLIRHAPETSFPSDHATFMFACALPLLLCARLRSSGMIFTLLALIGGLARVFCGVHYPMDIAGSAMVALATTLLTRLPLARLTAMLNRGILNRYDLLASRLAAPPRH